MAKKAANILKYTLSTALAVALVWFAFRGVDWKAFWEGVQQTRWVWVALYFVAAILALVFREERWYALIRPLDPEVRRRLFYLPVETEFLTWEEGEAFDELMCRNVPEKEPGSLLF